MRALQVSCVVMIDTLHVLARTLHKLRFLFLFLGIAAAIIFALSLLGIAGLSADRQLVPAIVVFCWSATLLSFTGLFAQVPHKPDKSMAWRRRLSLRWQRLVLGFLGLLMAALTIATFVLSWQLFRAGLPV